MSNKRNFPKKRMKNQFVRSNEMTGWMEKQIAWMFCFYANRKNRKKVGTK